MRIQRVDREHAAEAIALLVDLRVSLFGIQSRRLHSALIADALKDDVDCRVAVDGGDVCGVVLAAPKAYWRSALLKHWGVAVECARARLVRGRAAHHPPLPGRPDNPAVFRTDAPPRSWKEPRDAWRIIFVGTAAAARGKGVAAGLYRSLMADRSLVAHVALDNAASIRLHDSLGWRLYRDGDVALAVHLRDSPRAA